MDIEQDEGGEGQVVQSIQQPWISEAIVGIARVANTSRRNAKLTVDLLNKALIGVHMQLAAYQSEAKRRYSIDVLMSRLIESLTFPRQNDEYGFSCTFNFRFKPYDPETDRGDEIVSSVVQQDTGRIVNRTVDDVRPRTGVDPTPLGITRIQMAKNQQLRQGQTDASTVRGAQSSTTRSSTTATTSSTTSTTATAAVTTSPSIIISRPPSNPVPNPSSTTTTTTTTSTTSVQPRGKTFQSKATPSNRRIIESSIDEESSENEQVSSRDEPLKMKARGQQTEENYWLPYSPNVVMPGKRIRTESPLNAPPSPSTEITRGVDRLQLQGERLLEEGFSREDVVPKRRRVARTRIENNDDIIYLPEEDIEPEESNPSSSYTFPFSNLPVNDDDDNDESSSYSLSQELFTPQSQREALARARARESESRSTSEDRLGLDQDAVAPNANRRQTSSLENAQRRNNSNPNQSTGSNSVPTQERERSLGPRRKGDSSNFQSWQNPQESPENIALPPGRTLDQELPLDIYYVFGRDGPDELNKSRVASQTIRSGNNNNNGDEWSREDSSTSPTQPVSPSSPIQSFNNRVEDLDNISNNDEDEDMENVPDNELSQHDLFERKRRVLATLGITVSGSDYQLTASQERRYQEYKRNNNNKRNNPNG